MFLIDERWLLAGVAAGLATATRPNGIALFAACAVAAAIAIHRRRDWLSLIAPLLAPVGFISFQLFLPGHTGESWPWFRVQREVRKYIPMPPRNRWSRQKRFSDQGNGSSR